jgi:acylphosphatase
MCAKVYGSFLRKEIMTKTNTIELARVHIWVSGRVQGVGFRAFVLQVGKDLGLHGWVHNLGYEQVETVAEGTRPVLERYTELVRNGPRAAHVENVRIEW